MAVYKAKMPEAWARIEWCKEQFGADGLFADGYPQPQYGGHNLTRGLRWWRRSGHLFFRNEQDYLFYLLKWG
jgi:hypothetical protein